MSEKMRADVYLFKNGYASSRQKASKLITSGNVFVDGKCIKKISFPIDNCCTVTVNKSDDEFVSRGGLKLLKAIEMFNIDLNSLVCADIGASTGGFTDCMLSHGASKVYAVDVGHDQLDKKLLNDDRVVNMEGVNARYLTRSDFECRIDFVSTDVSFISLKLILPVIKDILSEKGYAVCLVKPQFEAGKENVGKNGVIKDKKVHLTVLNTVYGYIKENEMSLIDASFSPIKGPQGNIEYLFYIKNESGASTVSDDCFDRIVNESHSNLDQKEA